MTITVEVPINVRNPTNTREHHMARAKRVKAQRGAVGMLLRANKDARRFSTLGLFTKRAAAERWVDVTLTRVYSGQQRAMDDDGNIAALKHVRDEVAAYFGVNDNDPRVEWKYAQQRGGIRAVRIEFEVTAC